MHSIIPSQGHLPHRRALREPFPRGWGFLAFGQDSGHWKGHDAPGVPLRSPRFHIRLALVPPLPRFPSQSVSSETRIDTPCFLLLSDTFIPDWGIKTHSVHKDREDQCGLQTEGESDVSVLVRSPVLGGDTLSSRPAQGFCEDQQS